MRNPMPRIQMLEGFNDGWIDFEGSDSGILKGKITARAAIVKLLQA
jgi:hypothetical protein